MIEPAREQRTTLPVVRPLYPLLGTLLAGAWLGWPWFIINAHALRSHKRRQVTASFAIGLAGSAGVAWLTFACLTPTVGGHAWFPYIALGLAAWKAALAMLAFRVQTREVETYEYRGGKVRTGVIVAALGTFVRHWVLFDYIPFGWWTLVLT